MEIRRLLSAAVHADAAEVHRYDHVVVVMEENQSYDQILGTPLYPPQATYPSPWATMPDPLWPMEDTYIRQLAKFGVSFTDSHALAHPSQPNYLDLFSGLDQGVKSDSTPNQTFAGPDLGGELLAAGLTFAGYSESTPHPGYAGPDTGRWVRHHLPWVNFSDVPASDNRSLRQFPHDLGQLPTVSFVIPNLSHDMHSGTIRAGDQWLRQHMKRYVKWAHKHNSLLIVTWDEAKGPGAGGNRVPTIFSGPNLKRGQSPEPINHFNVLRTIEDMYGLPPTGAAADETPITDVFTG